MICRPCFQTQTHFPDFRQEAERKGILSPNKNRMKNQNCKFPIPNSFFAAGILKSKNFKNNTLLLKTPLVPAGIRGGGFGDSLSLRTRGESSVISSVKSSRTGKPRVLRGKSIFFINSFYVVKIFSPCKSRWFADLIFKHKTIFPTSGRWSLSLPKWDRMEGHSITG